MQGSDRSRDVVDRPTTGRSASPAGSDRTLSPEHSVSAEVEPKIDPSLEKYMAIVKQQRELEQQVCNTRKSELC